jgi:hypothetical protein
MTNTNTRPKKMPTMDEHAKHTKQIRAALAQAGGVPVEKVNIEKLEIAMEKAKSDICTALGVPLHAITLNVAPAIVQAV